MDVSLDVDCLYFSCEVYDQLESKAVDGQTATWQAVVTSHINTPLSCQLAERRSRDLLARVTISVLADRFREVDRTTDSVRRALGLGDVCDIGEWR